MALGGHQRTFMHALAAAAGVAAALYLLSGSPYVNPAVNATWPLPGGTTYCISVNLTAQADWTDSATAGMFQVGTTFGAANTLSLYRFSNQDSCFWIAKLFNNAGATSECDSNTDTTTLAGRCVMPTHQVTFCEDGVNGYWLIDGVQTKTCTMTTSITLPTSMQSGGLGGSSSPYGNGITKVCVAGPNGQATGTPASDINNTCGQFNNTTPALAAQFACYGCLGSAPNGNAKKVYALGDSITYGGVESPRPWPAKLNASLGVGYNVTNAGVAGDLVANMKGRYEATARNWDRCLFLGGVNDIIRNGATGAATFTTASALLDEMRADGCKPIVVMPTPIKNSTGIGWTSGRQTEYDSYRTSLSSYCTTNSATTTCVDTYGAGPAGGLGDGTSPPQLYSTYDSGDQVHPSQAGLDKIAALVFAGATWP